MAGSAGSEDVDQPRTEETPDGPWNQPAVQAARARQVSIKIGDLPVRAAPIGQPYARGNRKAQAVLITPEKQSPELRALRQAAAERAAARRMPPAEPGLPKPEPVQEPDPVQEREVVQERESVQERELVQARGSVQTVEPVQRLEQAQPVDSAAYVDGLDLVDVDQPTADAGVEIFDSIGSQRKQSRRHGRRWPLVATGVAFAFSVAIPVVVHVTTSSHARPASVLPAAKPVVVVPRIAPTVQLRAQSLAWARSYLPRDAVIVADASSAGSLRSAGFSSAEVFGRVTDVPVQTIDYVLDLPATDATEDGPSGRSVLAAHSLPLAAFGSGSEIATVREFFPAGTTDAANRKVQDVALRKQGGSELVQNASLVFDQAGKTILTSGRLDLRAQNVLTLLANTGTIYVTVGAPIAAEARLGQPVRSLTVTTSDPASLQDVLGSMVAPYRPDSIAAISDRKFRLTWNPAIAPVLPVGQ